MADIFTSYISKVVVKVTTPNDDVVDITTNYLSPQGDVFQLDKRTISPVVITTTQSLNDLSPEVSTVYPYKMVPPTGSDGSTLLLSPSIDTPVTASQNYYVPIYFERYQENVLSALDKQFYELVPPTIVSQINESIGEASVPASQPTETSGE